MWWWRLTKPSNPWFCRDSIICRFWLEMLFWSLYFVKLGEKRVTTEDLRDAFGHVMRTGNCTSKRIIWKQLDLARWITNNSKLFRLLWGFSLMKFTIHTLTLMRICRLILTFITLFYWKICKYCSYRFFKMLYSWLGWYFLVSFLVCWMHGNKSSLPVLLFFIKTFREEG